MSKNNYVRNKNKTVKLAIKKHSEFEATQCFFYIINIIMVNIRCFASLIYNWEILK